MEESRPGPGEPHPGVLGLALGFYAAMVGLMWLAFARIGEDVAVLLVVTLVFVTFAVVPIIVLRFERKDAAGRPVSFRGFLDQGMDTLTGPLGGRAALVQIIVVPALLTLCLIGITVAWMVAG